MSVRSDIYQQEKDSTRLSQHVLSTLPTLEPMALSSMALLVPAYGCSVA
jgi:hypothetical protein